MQVFIESLQAFQPLSDSRQKAGGASVFSCIERAGIFSGDVSQLAFSEIRFFFAAGIFAAAAVLRA